MQMSARSQGNFNHIMKAFGSYNMKHSIHIIRIFSFRALLQSKLSKLILYGDSLFVNIGQDEMQKVHSLQMLLAKDLICNHYVGLIHHLYTLSQPVIAVQLSKENYPWSGPAAQSPLPEPELQPGLITGARGRGHCPGEAWSLAIASQLAGQTLQSPFCCPTPSSQTTNTIVLDNTATRTSITRYRTFPYIGNQI